MAELSAPRVDVPPPLPVGVLPQEETCKLCGTTSVPLHSQLAICEPCRQLLVRRPLPGKIKATALIVALLVVVAFTRFPAALKAAASYERGKAHEARKEFRQALANYEAVEAIYPGGTELELRLAVAAYRSGEFAKSARALEQISGRQVEMHIANEANNLLKDLQAVAADLEAQSPR